MAEKGQKELKRAENERKRPKMAENQLKGVKTMNLAYKMPAIEYRAMPETEEHRNELPRRNGKHFK